MASRAPLDQRGHHAAPREFPLQPPPQRTARHDALACFLGEWAAEGTSFGGPDKSGERWRSTHSAHWHTGNFFIIQDERATIAGKPFDTLSIIGVDPDTGGYFVRSIENHGFYRHYQLARDGDVWTLTGATERARTEFTDDDRTQVIKWEWKPEGQWLPLCDRVAKRID